jgi:hypothetical protein
MEKPMRTFKHYWAVRPVKQPDQVRIEQASTALEACGLAFGRPILSRHGERAVWEAKDLGTRVAVIQSDNKRLALLRDPAGWQPLMPAKSKNRLTMAPG